MLNVLRRKPEKARLVRLLYAALTSQARQPAFFVDYGVSDTIDGRFDMLTLHAWMVFGRLRFAGLEEIARSLSDAIFVGFDGALRDLGAGDMGMGRRIKQMGDAFNGRMQAYQSAADETQLAEAIQRNVYRGAAGRKKDAMALARYTIAAQACLTACDPMTGALVFGPVPARQE